MNIDFINIIQFCWHAQLLLLLSQCVVWLLETLKLNSGLQQIKQLDEPFWIMSFLCLFAVLIPLLLNFLTAKPQVITASIGAAIWLLLFIGDTVKEWQKIPFSVRLIGIGQLCISVCNLYWSTQLKWG